MPLRALTECDLTSTMGGQPIPADRIAKVVADFSEAIVMGRYSGGLDAWVYSNPGRGGVENKHSSDDGSPPPPPHVCMSIHTEGKSCSDLGRVLVLNDPTARCPDTAGRFD